MEFGVTMFRSLRTSNKQHGIAMVEFAIVLPILLILTMASAEFGRAFVQYNALDEVSARRRPVCRRQGVEWLDRCRPDQCHRDDANPESRDVWQHRRDWWSAAAGLVPGNVTVVPGPPGSVIVSAAYTYVPVFASLPQFQFGSIGTARTLSAAVAMRAL